MKICFTGSKCFVQGDVMVKFAPCYNYLYHSYHVRISYYITIHRLLNFIFFITLVTVIFNWIAFYICVIALEKIYSKKYIPKNNSKYDIFYHHLFLKLYSNTILQSCQNTKYFPRYRCMMKNINIPEGSGNHSDTINYYGILLAHPSVVFLSMAERQDRLSLRSNWGVTRNNSHTLGRRRRAERARPLVAPEPDALWLVSRFLRLW